VIFKHYVNLIPNENKLPISAVKTLQSEIPQILKDTHSINRILNMHETGSSHHSLPDWFGWY